MERRKFLGRLGAGAAFALTVGCMGSCRKKDIEEPPGHILPGDEYQPPGEQNVDITIDITDPAYSNLNFPGGWVIYNNSIVIAKTEGTGELVAATRICSDEVLKGIIYAGNEWYCTEHDATFTTQGVGTQTHNNKGFRGLMIYDTVLNGNLLKITSQV